jgi:subfamily B ATP-binding cassette protein MsbA
MKQTPGPDVRYLLAALRPYRTMAVIVVATSFASSLCDGISIGMLIPLLSNIQGVEGGDRLPRMLQAATDMMSSYPVTTQIYLSIAFVVTAMLLKNLLLGVSIRFGYRVSSGLAADLRRQATGMLLDVGLEFHHRSKAGELIEKAVYSPAALEDLVRNAVEMVAQIITFLVLFSLLIILSWKLTVVTALIGIVFMWLISVYTRRLFAIGQEFATSSRSLLSGMHEGLGGIQVIKSFGREESQRQRIGTMIDRQRRASLRLNFGNYAVHLLTDVLGALSIGVLFIVSMRIYEFDTKVLIVLLLPFVYVITRIIPVLKQINVARAVIASRWAFMRVVYDFLRLEDKPFVKSGEKDYPGFRSEIRFDQVTFRYDAASAPALDNVSFRIERGKTTALVGRSGSGKSTIIGLLQRHYDPQQGALLVDGLPIDQFDAKSFRRSLGVVSQDVFMFNDTVRFNIGFGADDPDDRRVVDAARRAGAHEFITQLPDGYDTVLGDRGMKLSGGQRQRISIARAVLRDPEILILDEATSSLDTRTEEQIHEAIAELGRDRTVIVIAHRLSTIENADRIIVMKNGRVAEEGAASELLAMDGEFRWLSQHSPSPAEQE